MKTECPGSLELYEYNAGRLVGHRRQEIQEHLDGCGDCERRRLGEGLFEEAMRQAVKEAVPPQVLARLKASGEASRRSQDVRGHDQARGVC